MKKHSTAIVLPLLGSLATAVLLLFLVTPNILAQTTPQVKAPYQFLVMSDIQFGMFTGNKGFEKESQNFEKAVAYANKLHPEFIVMCGDLVNLGGDQNQIKEYKRIEAQLDPSIPLYSVPGNHDIGNQPTAQAIKAYQKSFGKDFYSFQKKDIYGIVLNSMLISYPELVPKEAKKQFAWLQSELKKAKKAGYSQILIFQHIPFFVKDVDEETSHYSEFGVHSIPKEKRAQYLDLFHQYDVHFVFAGHLHYNAEAKDGDLNLIVTSALGKPLGEDPSGFRIVTVKDGQLNYPYYGLDEIPDTQELQK